MFGNLANIIWLQHPWIEGKQHLPSSGRVCCSGWCTHKALDILRPMGLRKGLRWLSAWPQCINDQTQNIESTNPPHKYQTMVSFEFLLTEWRPSKDCWVEGMLTDFGMSRITLWLVRRHSLYNRQWYLNDTWGLERKHKGKFQVSESWNLIQETNKSFK